MSHRFYREKYLGRSLLQTCSTPSLTRILSVLFCSCHQCKSELALDGERQDWTHLSLLCSYYCIIIIAGAINTKKRKTQMQNFPKLNTISTVSILALGSLAVQHESPPALAQTSKTDIVQQKKQSSGSRLWQNLSQVYLDVWFQF